MSDILDLNCHDIEEVPGKMLNLAGAQYIFQDLLAEGGEKYVYPIKNARSGLILYVAKIFKCRPGSAEAEEAVASLPWKVFALVPPKLMLYTEVHTACGAVIELQPYGVDHNPEFQKPLMDEAMALQQAGRWAETSRAYDDLLRHNPNHSLAMLNKAVAVANLGNIGEAIHLVEQSIEIEPNFPQGYHLLSRILLQVAGPKAAMVPLRRTLERFVHDPITWELLLRTALDHDMVDIARNALDEVYRLGARPSGQRPQEFLGFEEEILAKAKALRQYSECLATALAAQQDKSWNVALELHQRAIKCSKNSGLAQLNAFICQYHLGHGKTIARELLGMLMRWNGVQLAAAASLGLLCASLADMPAEAKRIALWIASAFSHHADVPGVPVWVSESGAVCEEQSAQAIIDLLCTLESGCSKAEAAEIARVRKLYEQREVEFVRTEHA